MPKLTRGEPRGLRQRLALAIVEDGREPTAIARKACVDHSLVSRLLSGGRKDSFSMNLVKIANELNVNIAWLLTGEEPMRKGVSKTKSETPLPKSVVRDSRRSTG
jgi:transcriptional regulator with XRE-family HTH domain